MQFIQVQINLPGAETPYVLGCVFDNSQWHDQAAAADLLDGWMASNLESNDGALDLLCSDGVHRRIGAALMAQAIIDYQFVEMPVAAIQEDMRDAA